MVIKANSIKTPIASTTYFVSTDPELFPDPFAFQPERWVKSEDGERLDKYLTNFSKGTRSCVGQKYVFFSFPEICLEFLLIAL